MYPKLTGLLLTELGLKPCQMNLSIHLQRITGDGRRSAAADVPALAWAP